MRDGYPQQPLHCDPQQVPQFWQHLPSVVAFTSLQHPQAHLHWHVTQQAQPPTSVGVGLELLTDPKALRARTVARMAFVNMDISVGIGREGTMRA